MRYPVISRPTETGYAVEAPDLPVCGSTGRTFEQALENARETITLHVEGLLQDGEPIPEPSSSLEIRIDDPGEIITFLEVDEVRRAA